MVDSRDILLGIIGLIGTVYGGIKKDLTTIVIGVATLFLAIQLKLSEQEEDIKILKAQINTQNELKRIRAEIEGIKKNVKK